MDYLPEWKIYLWKKLLLDQSSGERVFQPSDFIYFDEKAQVGVMQKYAQRSIDRLHGFENTAYAAALNGKKVKIDVSSSTPTSHQYYFFEPRAIMLALIDLAEGKPACLEIEDIKVGKDVIQKYRQERKRILALHERRRLASITMTHGGGGTSTPDNRYTDPFCGLPESVYKKVENGEHLTLPELRALLHKGFDESIYPSVHFKIQIHKKRLHARLNSYLDNFVAGKLIPPKGVRYFRFEEQKKNILLGVQSLVAEYGNNTPITFEEVAKRGGWENEDENHYRFYETIFALEKLEEISITNLRGDETIISVVEVKKEEPAPRETNSFDAEKEKAKITAIRFVADFKTAKEKWFNVKGIIDAIYKKLPPVEDARGVLVKPITLTDDDISADQRKILDSVLRHAYDNGVALYPVPTSTVVITSEPVRRFLNGENILINNLDAFDAYRAKINDLCDFVQKEGESRFPERAQNPDEPVKELSAADKKRLFILEKIKEEWDLAPKKNTGPSMLQPGLVVYEQRAGEVRIHERRFHQWLIECGIDFYQLQDILTTFRQEGLIVSFRSFGEYQ